MAHCNYVDNPPTINVTNCRFPEIVLEILNPRQSRQIILLRTFRLSGRISVASNAFQIIDETAYLIIRCLNCI